jgi:uncharacterized protein
MNRNHPLFVAHAIALILAIVGAINWGLVGAFDFNLVAALFGADSVVTNAVYILVGLSGVLLAATSLGMLSPNLEHDRRGTATTR